MARPSFATTVRLPEAGPWGCALQARRVGSCSGATRGASSTHADHHPAPIGSRFIGEKPMRLTVAWVAFAAMLAVAGCSKGDRGSQGQPGQQGQQGPAGPAGPKGEPGAIGAIGPQGGK